jgi:hypothetical protein
MVQKKRIHARAHIFRKGIPPDLPTSHSGQAILPTDLQIEKYFSSILIVATCDVQAPG